MKKLICLLAAFLLMVSLFGCGKQETSAPSEKELEATEVETSAAEDADAEQPASAGGFLAENDYDALTITFDSGEVIQINYDESIGVLENWSDTEFQLCFNSDEIMSVIDAMATVSDQYDSMEAYSADMGWADADIQYTDLSGLDFYYINDNMGWGYYFIPLANNFALYGQCNYYGELDVISELTPLAAWELFLGVSDEKAGEAEGATVEYSAPAALEDTIESMTYAIDGAVYRFPTPIMELLNNGWNIPSDVMRDNMEIPANDYLELNLLGEDGGTLYNVTLQNPTDEPIFITDGIVIHMIVAGDSNVDIQFPEGLSLSSTQDDLDALSDTSPVQNGNYSTYSWWNDESGAGIMAWYHPEIGLEYFQFQGL